jgi:hypothetical protein
VSTFILPPIAGDGDWPSLGNQVGQWQESMLAFGPGDLLGQSYRLDEEDWAHLERSYQVYPPQHEGRCRFVDGRCELGRICGRRRFDTAVLMLRKGSKKSERLASIGAAELGADAPVRCRGFRREGKVWVPVGEPVTSPFVFILAFAKEQAEDTSWDAMRQMILRGPAADLFDVWEDRIVRRDGDGEAKALATAPDSRDGGKTTFQGKEEGHRWTFPRQREAHQTTRANLSKRPLAEPWELHATTAYAPGEGSVIETLHEQARKLSGEAARKSRLYFFYRWADDRIRIRKDDGVLDHDGIIRAIDDASGPVIAKWSDAESIADLQFFAAGADVNYAERVWLNRVMPGSSMAFDSVKFKDLEQPTDVPAGSTIVLAWHGNRYWDAAGLVAVDVKSGYLWVPEFEDGSFACWERPDNAAENWEVPEDEVDSAIAGCFAYWNVWFLYMNPDRWEAAGARWAAEYGEDVVKQWKTNAWTAHARATRSFATSIDDRQLHHSGAAPLVRHVGAAHRRYLPTKDEAGKAEWVIQKERQDSPQPINLAQAAIIGWQARIDALKDGAAERHVWTAV